MGSFHTVMHLDDAIRKEGLGWSREYLKRRCIRVFRAYFPYGPYLHASIDLYIASTSDSWR